MGGWAHAALYIAVVTVAGPVLALWAVQGLTALQRSRLRATLGAGHPRRARGRPSAGRGRSGRGSSAATWRQLGFHLLSILTGVIGGGLVAACWLAPVAAIAYLAAARPPAAAGAAAVRRGGRAAARGALAGPAGDAGG